MKLCYLFAAFVALSASAKDIETNELSMPDAPAWLTRPQVEKVTARKVFPVMAPADYQGRSAGAPVKGPRGLIVSIAECPPHNGPGLHRHLNTVENFFCLTGRFEISWGDEGQHKLVLEPNDMISIPRGENRKFFNISDETGRLLVMIVPETDQQIDPITYAPSLGKEIENEYGREALEGLRTIGFKFEEPVD